MPRVVMHKRAKGKMLTQHLSIACNDHYQSFTILYQCTMSKGDHNTYSAHWITSLAIVLQLV